MDSSNNTFIRFCVCGGFIGEPLQSNRHQVELEIEIGDISCPKGTVRRDWFAVIYFWHKHYKVFPSTLKIRCNL